MFAWALPLFANDSAVGTPWSFAFDVLRGDLGVSPISGIDVDARVRVFALGSIALAATAIVVGAAVLPIFERLARLGSGRAGMTAVIVTPLLVGSIERWRLPDQVGTDVGDAVLGRLVALGLPGVALGCAVAFVASSRSGDRGVATWMRRDAETIIVGVLLTEVAFARDGLGTLLRDAVAHQDVAMIRGIGLVVATALASSAGSRTVPLRPKRLTRPNPLWFAGCIAAIVVVGLVLADVFGLPEPARIRSAPLSPSATAILGVDAIGRDNLARLLATARVTLAIAAAGVAVAVVLAVVLGAIVGSTDGRLGRTASAGLRVRVPTVLVIGAFLAVRGRPAFEVALALGVIVVLPLADAIAVAVDRAWRQRNARQLRPAVPAIIGISVSSIGTLFVVEVAFGALGIAVDGRTTLGREVGDQLLRVSVTPVPVMIAAVFTALVGWSVTALGYGVAGSEPSIEATASQSDADGLPQPAS